MECPVGICLSCIMPATTRYTLPTYVSHTEKNKEARNKCHSSILRFLIGGCLMMLAGVM